MRPSTVLSAFVLSTSLVAAQGNQNTINFSTIEVFTDLKRCLKAVFQTDYGINDGPVQKKIGCETNECICRADTLQEAISTAGLIAQSACSNTNDKLSATSILSQYCLDKGITGAPAPTNNAGSANSVVTTTSASEPNSPTPEVQTSATPVVQTTATPVVQTTNVVSTVSGSLTTIYSTVTSLPGQSTSPQTSKEEPAKSSSNIGAIAGGVVGGLVVLAAIGFLIWFLRKKRNNSYSVAEKGSPPSYEKTYGSNTGGMEMDNREIGGIQAYTDRS